MARLTRRLDTTRSAGFSLIEVMVAVVILATGLLALAALQGALARNSADAKARAAVMAAMTSRLSEIRQSPPTAGTTWTTATAWVNAASVQAGASDLQIVETIASWRWDGTDYVSTAVADPDSTFTRANLQATWTGASGSRTLSLSSDISSWMYGNGDGYPVPSSTSSASRAPVVRQDNPSNTAGVIPIVTGDQATAASNPQPLIKGSENNLRVGTSFDVLNYIPEGSTAKITKRFQTEVIKCRCEFGQAGYSVAGKAQWPAVWNGTAYAVYAGSGSPAGVAANAGEDAEYDGSGKGKKAARLQSEQCTECCRDHHDSSSTAAEGRYDPEATAVGKFNESSGVLTAASSGKYVAACRVVKVDGLWRTTADMYQRHYGLLETTSVAGVQAKTGIPSTAAISGYQTFVKDYLEQYTGTSTTAPSGAQTMFNETARGLNSPADIAIAAPVEDDSDWRYLHGRGLYVDYLGSAAQTAVGKAITKCPTGTDLAECILPVLPFTTINLTEMASWAASSAVLEINSDKAVEFIPAEPFGGRTTGRASGTATNTSTIRTSNSGVAIYDDVVAGVTLLAAVDDNGDNTTVNDVQSFTVGGTSTSTSDAFYVSIVGGASTARPSYTSPTGAGTCTYEASVSKWKCATSSTFPQGVTLVLSNYVLKDQPSGAYNTTAICTYNGSPQSATASISHPTFTNYQVSSASIGATAADSIVASNDAKYNETSTMIFSAVAKDATINVSLATQGSVVNADVSTCTTNNAGKKIENATWSKSWCPIVAGNPLTGCL